MVFAPGHNQQEAALTEFSSPSPPFERTADDQRVVDDSLFEVSTGSDSDRVTVAFLLWGDPVAIAPGTDATQTAVLR